MLINRENNQISLTEEGELFLQYSERILALCEESCRALDSFKDGNRGNLRVGASQTISTYLMPRIFALFTQHYPHINLTIQVDSTRLIAKNVVNQNLDIAVIEENIPDELKKKLKIENFVKDELKLIIPKSHPFSMSREVSVNKSDLYHLNFITLNTNSTYQKFIDNILMQNNIETKQFNIILQLNSIEAIKTAVSVGIGAAFVPSSAIEKEIELKTIEVIPIENVKINRTLSIITNPGCYKSKAFEFFYNELYLLKDKITY